MEVNRAYILSAGIGSRMGVIGKQLPKPLWPIFDKCLLQLQIDYLSSLNVNDIYINIHHQSEQMLAYLKSNFSHIKILMEPELLGVGGAIHNLASQKEIQYEGNVLVINSDQFLNLNKVVLEKALCEIKNSPAVLFSKMVENNDLYGAIKVDEDKLIGLTSNSDLPRDAKSLTYSGNSLINLAKLKPHPGFSNYFTTVADYKSEHIKIIEITDQDYWDFGTLIRYYDNCLKILKKGIDDPFVRFLIEHKAICPKLINFNNQSYASNEPGKLFFEKQHFEISLNNRTIQFKNYIEYLPVQSS